MKSHSTGVPTFSQGTFSIIAAPHESLVPAVASAIAPNKRELCLYVCCNYPVLLQKIDRVKRVFHVRRAVNAYQVLEILEESHHSLILFEHDEGLYQDEPELAQAVGMKCREKSGDSTIVIFHRRFDFALSLMEEFADRVVVTGETRTTGSGRKIKRNTDEGQKTLGSW